MVAIDGLECAKFEPPRQQLRSGAADKATYICSAHAKPTQPEVQEHWSRQSKMVPGAAVVPRPRGDISLAAGITGTRQNEGPLVGRELQQSVVGRAGVFHSVDIVDLEVVRCARLETWLVDPVLDVIGHGPPGSVEYRRFVHVVPESGNSVMNELCIERAPPFARGLACEVREHGRSGPDLADIDRVVGILYEVVACNAAIVWSIMRVGEIGDVQIRDGDDVNILLLQVRNHLREVCKLDLVDCERAMVVLKINIQIDRVHWDLVRTKPIGEGPYL